MSGGQIDRLCRYWLWENYGGDIASEYTAESLVVPGCNSIELDDALEALRAALSLAFGPEQSFGNTDYREAREKLGLRDGRTAVPAAIVRAFAASGGDDDCVAGQRD